MFPPVKPANKSSHQFSPTLYVLQYWLFKFIAITITRHTDHFINNADYTTLLKGVLWHNNRFTYSPPNSYTYRSHQPNDFHADTQSANLLHPTGKSAMLIVGKHIQCNFMHSSSFHPITTQLGQHDLTTLRMLNCKGIFHISNGLAIVRLQNYGEEGKQECVIASFGWER